jgi:hypothetical protein
VSNSNSSGKSTPVEYTYFQKELCVPYFTDRDVSILQEYIVAKLIPLCQRFPKCGALLVLWWGGTI